MFYSTDLFVRRGRFALQWKAAYKISSIRKKVIMSCDVIQLCNDVDTPDVPLALATLGKLMYGIVRIENRKARYLQSDAMHAQTRLRVRLVTSNHVTLQPNQLRARREAITLEPTDQATAQVDELFDFVGADELDALVMARDATNLGDLLAGIDASVAPGRSRARDFARQLGLSTQPARHTSGSVLSIRRVSSSLAKLPQSKLFGDADQYRGCTEDITMDDPLLLVSEEPSSLGHSYEGVYAQASMRSRRDKSDGVLSLLTDDDVMMWDEGLDLLAMENIGLSQPQARRQQRTNQDDMKLEDDFDFDLDLLDLDEADPLQERVRAVSPVSPAVPHPGDDLLLVPMDEWTDAIAMSQNSSSSSDAARRMMQERMNGDDNRPFSSALTRAASFASSAALGEWEDRRRHDQKLDTARDKEAVRKSRKRKQMAAAVMRQDARIELQYDRRRALFDNSAGIEARRETVLDDAVFSWEHPFTAWVLPCTKRQRMTRSRLLTQWVSNNRVHGWPMSTSVVAASDLSETGTTTAHLHRMCREIAVVRHLQDSGVPSVTSDAPAELQEWISAGKDMLDEFYKSLDAGTLAKLSFHEERSGAECSGDAQQLLELPRGNIDEEHSGFAEDDLDLEQERGLDDHDGAIGDSVLSHPSLFLGEDLDLFGAPAMPDLDGSAHAPESGNDGVHTLRRSRRSSVLSYDLDMSPIPNAFSGDSGDSSVGHALVGGISMEESPIPSTRRRLLGDSVRSSLSASEHDISVSLLREGGAQTSALANQLDHSHVPVSSVTTMTRVFRRIVRVETKHAEAEAIGISATLLSEADEQRQVDAVNIDFEETLRHKVGGLVSKRDTVLAFHELLVLKSMSVVDVRQEMAWSDIAITKGANWNAPL